MNAPVRQAKLRSNVVAPSEADLELRRRAESRILGLRVNRYSWWTHWRELADYLLPRRYKWIITPNQMARGSPINQHILDSTGTLAARNLAAGLMTGINNPTKPWIKLKINHIDSTQTSPTSLWLAECERLLHLICAESNWYVSQAMLYFDLVVFGTGVKITYEDFENVATCFNPCAGEYYLENGPDNVANCLGREFTYTISQTIEEFGVENCSQTLQDAWLNRDASQLSREIIVAHMIEPNSEPRRFGIPEKFKWREVYFEWGGSASQQGGSSGVRGILRKRGFYEKPFSAYRWDLVSNDAYGRSPGMDALPDVKQLQLESRRKAQAIDKMVNPPMVADIQLKNQPASLLPGGVTYVSGMTTGKVGFAPVYQVNPPVKDMVEDLNEVRQRIKEIFFNPLFQTISQFETRSNVSATEIDARRAESLIMLGPVFERIYHEGLTVDVERLFGMAARAGILPPAPPEIAGAAINIEFVSMLEIAQEAAATSGIERIFALLGNLGGIDPAAMDNVDIDFGLDKMSSLLNNDPRLIRSPEALASIRQRREQQAEQQQRAAQAEQLAKSAKVASETDIGGGQSALQAMTGGA